MTALGHELTILPGQPTSPLDPKVDNMLGSVCGQLVRTHCRHADEN
jgi:hypothetical protein